MNPFLKIFLIAYGVPVALVFLAMSYRGYRDGLRRFNDYLGALGIALAWPYTLVKALKK